MDESLVLALREEALTREAETTDIANTLATHVRALLDQIERSRRDQIRGGSRNADFDARLASVERELVLLTDIVEAELRDRER